MAIEKIVEIERASSAVPFAGRSCKVRIPGQVVCQQILLGILWPERESSAGGYSAKSEARTVRVKDAVKDVVLNVVELPLTPRRLLRDQMHCFFLFRIDHGLGS